MPLPGYILWGDGDVELLPARKQDREFAGCLLCSRTGEVMARWGWGQAGLFHFYHLHPASQYCPLMEEPTWWNTVSTDLPAPIFRRIFLYFCDEANNAGVL